MSSISNKKYCYCEGCRYPTTHITSYHKCGTCGLFGHGQYECSQNNNNSPNKRNALYYSYRINAEPLPQHLHCAVNDCKSKNTHSTSAHQPFFSQDLYGTLRGPDQYGITKHARENELRGEQLARKSRDINQIILGNGSITYI